MSDSWQPPYTFDRSHSTAQVHAEWDKLEDGAETEANVSVAGRLMLRREQGKICFGKLVDSSGDIQLFAGANVTDAFDEFKALNLGDWIGARGQVMKTKRGELSIRVTSWELLAQARRNFGDKFHGLTDTDLRYRQRYADLWANEGSREVFLIRSRMVSLMRRWMEDEGFIEVETPTLQSIAGGAVAKPFVTHHNALDMELHLRIAPELFLKRLIVGGIEKVFEIGRLYRNEGISTRHNPEFTTIEAYEAYGDNNLYMERVETLVAYLAQELLGTTRITYDDRELDLTPPWPRKSMVELIEEFGNVRVSHEMSRDELVEIAKGLGVEVHDNYGPGKLIAEIYEKTAEPYLWGPVFVTGHPKETSPLAREDRENPFFTERAEAVVAGRELSNGFSELIDPVEQRRRFEDQVALKESGDEEAMSIDEDYIRALEYGLPPTSGWAIGIDRLAMILTNSQTIRDVVLFPTLRPEQS